MFGVERCDLRRKGVAVLPEAIGVAAGLAVLSLGKRGLRHECTQTRVIGFVGQLDQLLGAEWDADEGPAHKVRQMAVDSGGHHAHSVYMYARERRQQGVIATKGSS
ncbi:MAG: hypothetical protein EBY52_03135, partial [Actinobacteria bacterium]|nr:hypothetical protein [Actinomycetota bacterium]